MKALVVEDDIIIALSMEQMLGRAGWEVVGPLSTAEDGVRAALAADELDIIILDIKLAGPMDGLEAAEAIRAHLTTPIIFCTSQGNDQTRERIELIADAFLMPKSSWPDALWRALQALAVGKKMADPLTNS